MFLSGNKKNIDTFWLKKAAYQELYMILDYEQYNKKYVHFLISMKFYGTTINIYGDKEHKLIENIQ